MTERDSTASLDDLLRHDEESAADRPDDGGGVWFAKSLAYSFLLSGLIWTTARISGAGLPFPLLMVGVMALFALRRVVREVAAPSPDDEPPRSAAADYAESQLQWPTSDGLFAAVARWDSRLNWTHRDAERFDAAVRPRVGELADERLRQRHGLTRASDPTRARELLGDPLWTFLATPVTRSPTPRQLAEVVRQLEEL